MGTNYYVKEKVSKEKHEEMMSELSKGNYEKVAELIEEIPQYHIGKKSGGWQFLFAPHQGKDRRWEKSPWENTLQSIKDYLSREDVIITDEYNEIFTPEEFWSEIGDSLYYDKDKYIDGPTYDKKEENRKLFIKCADYEFTTEEGLRFATTTDFS